MIHETAVISPDALISERANIGPHVVIEGPCVIAENVTVFPGAYIGKMPKIAGIVAVTPRATPGVTIGPGSVIGANAVIYAGTYISESVLIGDGATIRENCVIGKQSIVGNNCTLQNNVTMGDRVRVVDLSHITAHVIVESDAFISVGVLMMNDNAMGMGGELKPPYIHAEAKVGGGALLLPGVHVGHESIVGAGSVVTKNVGPRQKVMGVPARTKDAEKQALLGEFFPEALPPRPYDKWPPEEGDK